MNRKGFTLVEILIVLAILALLLLILVPNVFVLINKNDEKSCENLLKNIESAAKIYVIDNKYNLDIKCYDENNINDTTLKVTLNDLINSGDLTTDSSNKIINPINNTEINLDTVVEVIYNCDTKKFLYNVEGISCEKEDSVPILTVTSPTGVSSAAPTYNSSSKYTVSGMVFDEKNKVKSVTVNGVNAIIDGEGNWSIDIELEPNVATSVTVVATNSEGKQSVETRYVKYDKDDDGQVENENSIPINLKDYIISLYQNGGPVEITHSKDDGTSDKYFYSYQDDTKTWGLMNDGLKVSSDSSVGAISITDERILKNGTEGNIRYFGPSEKVNNYIYFNCEVYPDTNCELWRIIGIVDGKVKLIRSESIGDLAWDQDKNQDLSLITYNNNWETSSLYEFLNGLYYNRGGVESHLYYSDRTGTTTTTLNLKTIGITEATREMISESTWYLGGTDGFRQRDYPNDMYKYERTNEVGETIYLGNPYTTDAKVGLMYASDYGYGTNLVMCDQNLYGADTEGCYANNWLLPSFSMNQWIITSCLYSSSSMWYVFAAGYVNTYSAYNELGVRPVLYLNENVVTNDNGDGSSTNPYRIIID